MTLPEQVDALHDRLAGTALDLLFVDGAITRGDVPIGEVAQETFVEVMTTNAYAPMRFVEAFADLVPATGTIAVMSSHVATDLGGASATVPTEESVPGVVDTVTAAAGEPGLRFLDWRGGTVPW